MQTDTDTATVLLMVHFNEEIPATKEGALSEIHGVFKRTQFERVTLVETDRFPHAYGGPDNRVDVLVEVDLPEDDADFDPVQHARQELNEVLVIGRHAPAHHIQGKRYTP